MYPSAPKESHAKAQVGIGVMPKTRAEGVAIGCPAVHGGGNCPCCGDGVCGSALMELVIKEKDFAALEELPVGPVVILPVDGQES